MRNNITYFEAHYDKILYAINTLLQGFLKEGDIVVVTQMEHNAIKRPLNALKNKLKLEFE